MQIRGVVFDLDGTLVSQELDFEAIRREIGVPSQTPLLEALEQLDPKHLLRAREVLDRHERTAAASAVLNSGVPEFLEWLARLGIRRAVLSRNSRQSVATVVTRFGLNFDPIMTRDDAPY